MDGEIRVTHETLRSWPLPEPGSEKHRRGVVLVVAGSASTPGAALLSGEAALRAGAGKLRIATASSVVAALGVAVPEAGVRGFAETEAGDVSAECAQDVLAMSEGADAVLVGPGWVDPDDAEAFLVRFVTGLRAPLVIDALASTYVGRHREEVRARKEDCLLTVNPTELGHVLGVTANEVESDPCRAVTSLAASTGAVVVCGGATKTIGAPDGRAFTVPPSAPGMAVSGSGDAQAGLVSGLLARGADPVQAAVWGAWLHARAGDRVAEQVGPLGFLARELAGEVPRLLAET